MDRGDIPLFALFGCLPALFVFGLFFSVVVFEEWSFRTKRDHLADVHVVIFMTGFIVGHWWQGRGAECAGLSALFVRLCSAAWMPAPPGKLAFCLGFTTSTRPAPRGRARGRASPQARAVEEICRRSALSRTLWPPGPPRGAPPPRDGLVRRGRDRVEAARRRTLFLASIASRPGAPMAPRYIPCWRRAKVVLGRFLSPRKRHMPLLELVFGRGKGSYCFGSLRKVTGWRPVTLRRPRGSF